MNSAVSREQEDPDLVIADGDRKHREKSDTPFQKENERNDLIGSEDGLHIAIVSSLPLYSEKVGFQ